MSAKIRGKLTMTTITVRICERNHEGKYLRSENFTFHTFLSLESMAQFLRLCSENMVLLSDSEGYSLALKVPQEPLPQRGRAKQERV